jgi:hypothetical protein
MKQNSLKIGVVAKDKMEFESFVKDKCIPKRDFVSFVLISSFSSTNSLNLDLLLLANDTMVDLFINCRCLVR